MSPEPVLRTRPGRIPARDATWAGPGLPPGDPAEAGWEPVITRPDPMTGEEREAWLDDLAEEDEPFDPEEYPDPEGRRRRVRTS